MVINQILNIITVLSIAMKTFFQFMEQIPTAHQSEVDAARIKANSVITRQHNRYANLQRLHTNIHLAQTAAQERKDKKG